MKLKNKALVFTDLHITDEKVDLCTDIIYQLLECCDKYGVNTVFFMGDLLHNRSKQSLKCLLFVRDMLDLFHKNQIHIHLIAGNHDKVNLNSNESYISVFNKTKSDFVHIYTTYRVVNIGDDVRVAMIPYYPEDTKYLDIVKNMDIVHNTVLMTHIAIDGVKNNDGSAVSNKLSKKIFKKFKLVFIGHYHNRGGAYIGAAYQNNFGEDDKKGFVLLKSDFSYEYIRTEFPKYIQIKLHHTKVKKVLKFIKKHRDNKIDRVRLTIIGNDKDVVKYKNTDMGNIELKIKPSGDTVFIDDYEISHKVDKKGLSKYWVDYCVDNGVNGDMKVKGMKRILKCGNQTK